METARLPRAGPDLPRRRRDRGAAVQAPRPGLGARLPRRRRGDRPLGPRPHLGAGDGAAVLRVRRGDAAVPDRPGARAAAAVGAAPLDLRHGRRCRCWPPPARSPRSALALGQSFTVALVCGMGFAMSSTAIGLATLQEKNLLDTPGGQACFAVLLFQDLAVIPLLLVVGAARPASTRSTSTKVALALGMIALLIARRPLRCCGRCCATSPARGCARCSSASRCCWCSASPR